jgi:2-methoxy-6-polyprenyl-1,4-benzoquinol methylase
MHRIWKNTFIKEIAPTDHMKLIDVAGGTGDIAFRFLNHLKYSNTQTKATNDGEDQMKVTVCDINQNMLNVGQQRSIKMGFNQNIRWQQGNAENLLTEKSDSYDVYTIAFGIRNCTNLENVVKEAYRLLKPGGRFMCLEFSQTTNPEFTR